jgi:hypothetical protein
VDLELAGVPCAVVVTDVFVAMNRRQAEAWKVGWLPLVVLPHPVGHLPPAQAIPLFRSTFDDVVAALTEPAAVVQERYRLGPEG